MIRRIADMTTRICVLGIILACGCHRAAAPAVGPFAPAGTTANPATPPPLIPFTPFPSAATRVPPPPTGSSQATNGYAAPAATVSANPAAPSSGFPTPATANPSTPGTLPPNGFNGTPAAAPAGTTRSTMGGMPVTDLTSTFPPLPAQAIPGQVNTGSWSGNSYAQAAPAAAGWQTVQPAGAIEPIANPTFPSPAASAAAAMRPLTPVPAYYPGQAAPGGYPTQQTPSGYPAQQASATYPVPPTTPVYSAPSASGQPLPAVPGQPIPAAAPPANSLMWRNPALAR